MDIDRRTLLLNGIAAGALGSAGLLGAGVTVARSARFAQGFRRVEGRIQINGLPVQVGTPVRAGDVVTTGPDGLATLVIGDDAFLIGENAETRFPGVTAGVRVFTVIAGMMLSVFGPGRKRLDTPFATIGIRGSGAFVESRADLTYACICYGHADLRSTEAPQARETVQTTHHESPRFIHGGGAPRVIEPAPVINHTDEELILLESLVGRVPPFGSTPGDY
jgi:hypothetical protein